MPSAYAQPLVHRGEVDGTCRGLYYGAVKFTGERTQSGKWGGGTAEEPALG